MKNQTSTISNSKNVYMKSAKNSS